MALIGTHSPRQCGIATFTVHLAGAIRLAGVDVSVVAINDGLTHYDYPSGVDYEIDQDNRETYLEVAKQLNEKAPDVVCLQHEFGLFGGQAGSYVLDLLRNLNCPIVVTLHTVLEDPDPIQREVLAEIIQLSETVVVMSERGRYILNSLYRLQAGKIQIVPHGIPVVGPPGSANSREVAGCESESEKLLLTFGLISPDKGIETALLAMPEIVARHPEVRYIVAGATHPHIRAKWGEVYRESLQRLVAENGLGNHVRFINEFLSEESLTALLQAADIYITPYLKREQITSGTLAYAFGAGKAVVSTPYWHAEELLTDGAGILIPFGSPSALAEAVNELLDHPEELHNLQMNAHAMGVATQWPVIGHRYVELFARAKEASIREIPSLTQQTVSWQASFGALPRLNLNHLNTLTDTTGIFQHCTFSIPNRREGYCTDDNARAARLTVELFGAMPFDETLRLQSIYLSFLDHALDLTTGKFHNFMSYERLWLDVAGSEDSHGRALWALGTLAANGALPGIKEFAGKLFDAGLPPVRSMQSPRTWAFAILGLSEILSDREDANDYRELLALLASKLNQCYQLHSDQQVTWFEQTLAYDNARLPEALLRAGMVLGDPKLIDNGLRSLDWLAQKQIGPWGQFSPIGSDHPYEVGGHRPVFDQQPLEAAATIDACLAAYEVSGNGRWRNEAWRAFSWFLGANPSGFPLYDYVTGGCRDGVTREGVNQNQGAESTLAFLSSLSAVGGLRVARAAPVKAGYLH